MSANVSKYQYFLDLDILKLIYTVKILHRIDNLTRFWTTSRPWSGNLRIDIKNWRLYNLKSLTKSIMKGCFFYIYCFLFISCRLIFYKILIWRLNIISKIEHGVLYITFSLQKSEHLCFSLFSNTARKMKFSIKDFVSKCDQICREMWIWSNLLEKSLIENFIFCAV